MLCLPDKIFSWHHFSIQWVAPLIRPNKWAITILKTQKLRSCRFLLFSIFWKKELKSEVWKAISSCNKMNSRHSSIYVSSLAISFFLITSASTLQSIRFEISDEIFGKGEIEINGKKLPDIRFIWMEIHKGRLCAKLVIWLFWFEYQIIKL